VTNMFDCVGFIGTGNMGGAIARAVSNSTTARKILLANRTAEKAEKLAVQLKNAEVVSNTEAASRCDLLFLCVKPGMMAGVLREISETVRDRKDSIMLCSMAAGLSCDTIRGMIGFPVRMFRMMPNIPTAIGAGMTQYCWADATAEECSEFEKVLEASGLVEPIEERLIDAASAVSGCGPAFISMFAEAMADAGVACGLPRGKAMTFALQTLMGTAEMLLENKMHPAAMKDAVCSPGGTTIQGVYALEQAGFRGAIMDAVTAAYEKTCKMR